MKDPLKKLSNLGIDIGKEDKSKLTLDEIKAELKKLTDVENATGFLYFLVMYVHVSHPSRGSVSLKEEIYKWQWEASQDFIQHVQIISLKSRQIGYSTIVGAYALWRALFYKSQEIAIVSLGQRESTSFLKRIKFIYDHLPRWMQAKTSEFQKTSITFEHNNSTITSLPNTEDPARGESLSLLIADEFSAFKNPKGFLAAAIPAVSAGMMTPFSNQTLPSQFFIISTLPRNPLNNEYLRLLHLAQGDTDSEYHLIDPTVEDIPQYQDETWHKKQRESLGERLYLIEIKKQEVYDIETALLPASVLKKLEPKNPIRVDFLLNDDVDEEGYVKDFNKMIMIKDDFDPEYNYIKGLWIWEDPLPDVEYIALCDLATGRGSDWSVVQVFKLENYEQVAEYKGKANLEQYKDIIWTITKFYNNAKLSIEKQGLGEAAVSYFADTLNYENLYWHKKSKKKIDPGFNMSSSTRNNGIALFASVMTKGELIINSVRAINEIRSFGYTKTGRIQGIGSHDDLVMPIIQLCFLINEGFAATDKMIQEQLVFGQLIRDIDEKEKIKEEEKQKPGYKTIKYWEDKFDVQLDEDSRDFLRMCEQSGVSIPMAMMEAMGRSHNDEF